MSNQPPADFSFDLYPGLDKELQDVYDRNIANGIVSSEATATEGLRAAIQATTPTSVFRPEASLELSAEARTWAEEELDLDTIYDWYRYSDNTNVMLDTDPFLTQEWANDGLEVGANIEHFGSKIEKLYRLRQALRESNEFADFIAPVAEQMHLVPIPWKAFRDNLDKLPEFIENIRTVQMEQHIWIEESKESIPTEMLNAIQSEVPMYRNPIAGHVYTTTNSRPVAPDWISAKAYLDYHIARDGNWGIMLAQTTASSNIRLKRFDALPIEQQRPNDITQQGREAVEVANTDIGGLGIFEWLSLTFHEADIAGYSEPWLLANRFDANGLTYIPRGTTTDDGGIGVSLMRADLWGSRINLRPVVL